MSFPFTISLFGFSIHPHPLMESLAYLAGFQIYLMMRKRVRIVGVEQGIWLVVGAVFGALIGSKLLAWMESPHEFWAYRRQPMLMLTGKTIVGGLLGGWVGVEIAKRWMRITTRTGDACVWPLAVGIAVGRVGCFLTGLDDRTYGIATGLPWGVDFGDGISRHPTQLYESLMALLLAGFIWFTGRQSPMGARFRLFIAGYLLFRFGVEFIKPTFRPYLGLSAIQLACLAGAFVALFQVIGSARERDAVNFPPKQEGSIA